MPLTIAQESADTIHVSDSGVVIVFRTDAQITGGISDGKPGLLAPKPEPIAFDVKTTIIRRIHVEESPEMQGLPAPEGDINVTIQLVKEGKDNESPLPPCGFGHSHGPDRTAFTGGKS